MSLSNPESIARVTRSPLEYLKGQTKAVLENAAHAHRNGLKVYESLRNLSDVIGTEYGDRVLYELIQNAHDAHPNVHDQVGVKGQKEPRAEGTFRGANVRLWAIETWATSDPGNSATAIGVPSAMARGKTGSPPGSRGLSAYAVARVPTHLAGVFSTR
jgi:hypothetical protein